MFDLRSSSFELVLENESVKFKVKGYGHGVGLSQRGADICAKNGMNYKDIIKKYYTGVTIDKY